MVDPFTIADVDPDATAYLNGQFLPISQAKISVLDRGFIFGDGVYEVVPAYNGKPFRLAQHLQRLERSLSTIKLQTGMSPAQWEALIHDLLSRAQQPDSLVYLQVTRGAAKRDHAFPKQTTPTIFGMVSPLQRPSDVQRTQGLSAIGVEDVRWLLCHIKSTSMLGNVLAKQQAVEAGVDEVVQFRNGFLTEGSSCNIWVVQNGVLLAPPCDHLILEGIRYGLLGELAAKCGLPHASRPITRPEVENADELLLTSASKEILPIVRFDGQPVGNDRCSGKPGAVYARLRRAYDELLQTC